MYLLLFVWLPPQSRFVIDAMHVKLAQTLRMKPYTLALVFYVAAGTTGMIFAARNGFNLDMQAVDLGIGVWWWQTLLVVVALWALRGLPQESGAQLLRVRSTAARLYILFVIFNCLCPYIGLKDRLALTMHSNLLTAKGYWNHLFLPEGMRVFRYQDNLVTIVDSDLPDFAAVAEAGTPMPYFEFRRWCRRINADFHVDYLDSEGASRRFEKLDGEGSDPTFMAPRPLLEKFLCFNPVGASYDYIPELIPHVGPARNSIPKHGPRGDD